MNSVVPHIGDIKDCLVTKILLDIQIPLLCVGRRFFRNVGHNRLSVDHTQIVTASAYWLQDSCREWVTERVDRHSGGIDLSKRKIDRRLVGLSILLQVCCGCVEQGKSAADHKTF